MAKHKEDIIMATPTCSTGTKPNYTNFASSYKSYAINAAKQLRLPVAFVLCHWYQEWGIPANNPAWQTWKAGLTPYGWCGDFPMFKTLDDGVTAYVKQMNFYNDNASHKNVFGDAVSISNSYNWGFRGGQKATIPTDDGSKVAVTSEPFNGAAQSGGSGKTGTYAANEAIGASPWDYGHYMLKSDTYPGRRLNVILNNSGWASDYCYVPPR